MVDQYNNLTRAEDERLTLLIEECAEVIKVACKIKRYGFDNHTPEHQQTNRQKLETELGHVQLVFGRMIAAQDINQDAVTSSMVEKGLTGGRWLHHQKEDTH